MPRRSTNHHLPKGIWLCAAAGLLLAPGASAEAHDSDPWFGRDKALHFGVSTLLASGGYGATTLLSDGTAIRLAGGAGLALSAGIAKEVYDRYSGGDASLRDLTWDAVGTATGLVVSWLIDRYLF